MRTLFAFMKKEYLETARTGKLIILVLLFALFGVMNPAIAKLTPWMMEMFSDSLVESGLIVANVQVDAMTSWTQFFKATPHKKVVQTSLRYGIIQIWTNKLAYPHLLTSWRKCGQRRENF